MNILYLSQYFKFPHESGSSRAYDLATSFTRKGHNVKIICSTSDIKYKTKKKWNIECRDGLEVHRIFLPYDNKMSYLKRMLVFLKFVVASTQYVIKIKADLVLATSTPLTIGIPAVIKKKKDKTPFIFEVRDVWPEAVIAIGAIKNKLFQRILYKLEKTIYSNAAFIVPLSIAMKESIDKRYPEFKEKTGTVIPNISEINRFQKRKHKKDLLTDIIEFKPRFSILYAGTFGRVNGIYKVVELAEKTMDLDPKLVYILIGRGVKKEEVQELARKKKVLNKNLFILDPVAKEDLPYWYAASSMGSSFVIDIPELWANSASKFFDTLAASKPVLINHEGWQADVIRNKNIGYVLPFRVTSEEAKKFVDYTKNEQLYKKQEENALNIAKERYSLEVATEKYLMIFDKFK